MIRESLSRDEASHLIVISDDVVDGTRYSCNVLATNGIGDGPPTQNKTVIASSRQGKSSRWLINQSSFSNESSVIR